MYYCKSSIEHRHIQMRVKILIFSVSTVRKLSCKLIFFWMLEFLSFLLRFGLSEYSLVISVITLQSTFTLASELSVYLYITVFVKDVTKLEFGHCLLITFLAYSSSDFIMYNYADCKQPRFAKQRKTICKRDHFLPEAGSIVCL